MAFSVPYNFQANQPAVAAEVNANFNAIAAELDAFPTQGALRANAVGTSQIANEAVTAAKLAGDAVTQHKIALAATDDTTIALDNGKLTVKDGGITAGKIGPGAVDMAFPHYKVYCLTGRGDSVPTPALFVTPAYTFRLPSFGTINLQSDGALSRFIYNQRTMFEMKVNCTAAGSFTWKSLGIDNECIVYVNGNERFRRTAVYAASTTPLDVTIDLIEGENLVQICHRDAGSDAALSLLGDLINGTTRFFAGTN